MEKGSEGARKKSRKKERASFNYIYNIVQPNIQYHCTQGAMLYTHLIGNQP